MMKIGELARRGKVSIKALRHYHELGLLQPDNIDESGHRVYSSQSLQELRKLQTLKKLGFSLLEIQSLISNEQPSYDKSLEFQKNKIQKELEKKQHELHRIEVAKKMINETNDVHAMMDTVQRLAEAEVFLSFNEIKKIEKINQDEVEIQELIKNKKFWYEGMQQAFKDNVSIYSDEVKAMAYQWDKYATYWKNAQPEIARKVALMEKENSNSKQSVLYHPEFQLYVKSAITALKNVI